jgi:hypothetical protein
MSKIYPEDSVGPEDFIWEELPEALNPELYKTTYEPEEEDLLREKSGINPF